MGFHTTQGELLAFSLSDESNSKPPAAAPAEGFDPRATP